MERGNLVDEGKHPPLSQEIEDLTHAGDRQLAEAADRREFLVVLEAFYDDRASP